MNLAPAYVPAFVPAFVTAAAMMAAGSLAQANQIEACAAGPQTCNQDILAEELGLLDHSDVRVFGDAGLESFAMLTALRYAASALYFHAEGEGCIAEEERTAALDIWSLWVRLPSDAPDVIAAKFDVYDKVMNQIVTLQLEC